ncbi:hypothetical protein ACI65C_005448 [Semiaphis heraclei]
MDTNDTTIFRGRGSNGICYISIAIIAVITGIYVTIVSFLRFGRFLVGFNATLPSDNDLLPSASRPSTNLYPLFIELNFKILALLLPAN